MSIENLQVHGKQKVVICLEGCCAKLYELTQSDRFQTPERKECSHSWTAHCETCGKEQELKLSCPMCETPDVVKPPSAAGCEQNAPCNQPMSHCQMPMAKPETAKCNAVEEKINWITMKYCRYESGIREYLRELVELARKSCAL